MRAWILLLAFTATLGCGERRRTPRSLPWRPEVGREAAIAAIEKVQGYCLYYEGNPARPVQGVVAHGPRVTDAALEPLKGLTNLQNLSLEGSKVTGPGMEYLKGLTSLHELWLSGTPVDDAGLAHLKGLTNLRRLILGGTRVSDAGLEYLKGMTQLRELLLNYTQVGDPGLQHLAGLTRLRYLHLSGTQVTNVGLEHLKGLPSLEWLSLEDTQATQPDWWGYRFRRAAHNPETCAKIGAMLFLTFFIGVPLLVSCMRKRRRRQELSTKSATDQGQKKEP